MKKIIMIAAMSVASFAECQEPLPQPARSAAPTCQASQKLRLPFAKSNGESLVDKELRKKIIGEVAEHSKREESIFYPELRRLQKSSDSVQKSQNIRSTNTSTSPHTPVKKNKRKKLFRQAAIAQALFGANALETRVEEMPLEDDFFALPTAAISPMQVQHSIEAATYLPYVESWPQSQPQFPDNYGLPNERALTPEQIENVRSLFDH